MTREWRILVDAAQQPRDFTSPDGTICICLADREWTLYTSRNENAVRGEYADIAERLPEALPHLHIQTRDVTDWEDA